MPQMSFVAMCLYRRKRRNTSRILERLFWISSGLKFATFTLGSSTGICALSLASLLRRNSAEGGRRPFVDIGTHWSICCCGGPSMISWGSTALSDVLGGTGGGGGANLPVLGNISSSTSRGRTPNPSKAQHRHNQNCLTLFLTFYTKKNDYLPFLESGSVCSIAGELFGPAAVSNPGAFFEYWTVNWDTSKEFSFFEPVTLLSSSRNLCKSVVSFRICRESSSTDIQKLQLFFLSKTF